GPTPRGGPTSAPCVKAASSRSPTRGCLGRDRASPRASPSSRELSILEPSCQAGRPLAKQRLDNLLVARGLAPSRARAQAVVLAGQVFVGGSRVDKAGTLVTDDAPIELRGADHAFVSRGGIKLAGALDAFALDVRGLVCLDLGASTGGFTDCL